MLGVESLGADGWLGKPSCFAELVARVHAMHRRGGSARPPVLRHGDIALEPARRTATRGGRDLGPSQKEFGVLETLLRADGAVVGAEALLEAGVGRQVDPVTNTVRITIMEPRRKLGAPAVVHAVPGAGYRL